MTYLCRNKVFDVNTKHQQFCHSIIFMQHRIVVSLNCVNKSCGCVQNSYVVVHVYVEKLRAQADTSMPIRLVSVLLQGYGYGYG